VKWVIDCTRSCDSRENQRRFRILEYTSFDHTKYCISDTDHINARSDLWLWILIFFFEAEGFGLPCTAWTGSGLLVKSRLIMNRADEGTRERTRTFEIKLVLAPPCVTFPLNALIGTP
jgi:hypothetical protein